MLSVDTLYLQIFGDRFVVKNIDSGVEREARRDPQFASPRMLVGDYTVAEQQLKELVKSVRRGLRAPALLVHPMERIEGGVTQIEHRVFRELGIGAGAARVGVYTGAVLSGDAVRQAIRDTKP